MLAYDLGCKGITYMREGSRPGVLSRKEEKKEEEKKPDVPVMTAPEIKPRPMVAHGSTYQVETPVGVAYVTINTNGGRQPLEMFLNVGKAGSDVQAMAEAMGRLISMIFRMSSPISPMERAHKIAAELIGIGGARSLGFGENRVRSLPDAIAKVIDRHYGFFTKHSLTDASPTTTDVMQNANGPQQQAQLAAVVAQMPENASTVAHIAGEEESADSASLHAAVSQPRTVTVDLCPSCGEGSLVFEESCKKCYSCGYSEC
jgi:ribonucleoside-diphosphate reductase alpha chain